MTVIRKPESERRFPVLWQGRNEYIEALKRLGCPRDVPWAFIDEVARACKENHDQTPARLAARGGLAPEEIVAVRLAPLSKEERKRWWQHEAEEAVPRLRALLAEWEQARARVPNPLCELHGATYVYVCCGCLDHLNRMAVYAQQTRDGVDGAIVEQLIRTLRVFLEDD